MEVGLTENKFKESSTETFGMKEREHCAFRIKFLATKFLVDLVDWIIKRVRDLLKSLGFLVLFLISIEILLFCLRLICEKS